jgi:spore coat-associated protein N
VSHKGATGTKVKKAFLTLVVLALLAVALQSLVFSGASFTTSSKNPGNSLTAGTLSHVNSKDGQVVLNAANLRPGQSQNGSLTITGGGDFSALYTITKVSLTDTPASPALSAALTLTIDDMTTGVAVQEWTGRAGTFASVTIDTIAPGATRTYRFTLTYQAASAVPALQGATMALRLQFTGVQQ